MELYLIRHGQSLNNSRPEWDRVEDPSLTDIGHQQCSHLADWIPSLRLTRVVTSPFLRALQTAERVCRSLRLKSEVRVDLHERGGCMSGPNREVFVGRPGMSRSQIREKFPEFDIAVEIGGNGWWGSKPFESDEAARQRAARLLTRTVDEFADTDERVAYIMHGDFERVFLLQLHTEPLEIPFNTSVTKVLLTPERGRFEEYNRVDHLPPDLVTW